MGSERKQYGELKTALGKREWNIGEYSSAKTEQILKIFETAG